LESGRFDSIGAAQRHYEIGGSNTISKWLRRFGKAHLQPKVIRVQKPNEAEQLGQLRRWIAELERALGQTQAQNVLNAEYLQQACAQLGEEVEAFKKSEMASGPRRGRTVGPDGRGLVPGGGNDGRQLLPAASGASAGGGGCVPSPNRSAPASICRRRRDRLSTRP
jgi:transposase-like protein